MKLSVQRSCTLNASNSSGVNSVCCNRASASFGLKISFPFSGLVDPISSHCIPNLPREDFLSGSPVTEVCRPGLPERPSVSGNSDLMNLMVVPAFIHRVRAAGSSAAGASGWPLRWAWAERISPNWQSGKPVRQLGRWGRSASNLVSKMLACYYPPFSVEVCLVPTLECAVRTNHDDL